MLKWRRGGFWAIAIAIFIIATCPPNLASPPPSDLPPLQVHPLPSSLQGWHDPQNSGDYFNAIKPTPVGSLIWSSFPVKVYIETPPSGDRSFERWFRAVAAAVEEWNAYLPLTRVEDRETADIICLRSRPPRHATYNRETRSYDIPIARNGEARYQLYQSGNPSLLSHRFTLHLHPNRREAEILATARHELGHALGIWGHSPVETDALYGTQVRNPPPISARDINTLVKIYQQPTRLGH